MITFKGLLFIIISLLFFIIPIIICYKYFPKGEKGSLLTSMSYVSILTFTPSTLSSTAVQLPMIVIIYMFSIIGICIGITFVIVNFFAIKKNIQFHDHFIINYACGVFTVFTFFCYFMIGLLICILTDKNGKIKYFEQYFTNDILIYASVYIFIYFLGVSSSLVFEFIFYKYNKFKYLIVLAFIIQFLVYSGNCFIIFDVVNLVYFNLIISIISIVLSIYAWFNFSKNEDVISEIQSSKGFTLTDK